MVTDKQVRKLWQLLTAGKGLAVAAVRTDMDEKTAHKFRRLQKLPSELAKPHNWQTRLDPFAEVWRADDLTLGQPVALKFLPQHLGRDPTRLAYLHNEV